MKPVTYICAVSLAILCLAAPAHAEGQRSGPGPCRQGVLGLIAALDANEQATPGYRKTARDVLATCGASATTAVGGAGFEVAACRKLALAMLDAIEDGKMASDIFTQAKANFARRCVPG
jgi:hypothetical protein